MNLEPFRRLSPSAKVLGVVLAFAIIAFLGFVFATGWGGVLLSAAGIAALLLFFHMLGRGSKVALEMRRNSLEGRTAAMADLLAHERAKKRRTPTEEIDDSNE